VEYPYPLGRGERDWIRVKGGGKEGGGGECVKESGGRRRRGSVTAMRCYDSQPGDDQRTKRRDQGH
jgi:hypothetical protein